MSLLDALPGLIEDRGAGVIERLAERAIEAIADSGYPEGDRDLAHQALDAISANSANLAHLGAGGLVSVLTYSGIGSRDKARLAYLASGASFEERRAASHAATAASVEARLERERNWEQTKAMLETIGKVALKVIPLLLAAA